MSDSNELLAARVRRLEDLVEIHQLFIDYGEHLDAGDFDAYSQLFAEDGEVRLGPMGKATGREAIKELMVRQLSANVGTTFHIISSPRVALDGDSATATVMWSVAVTGEDGMARLSMVGHHIDVLSRTSEGWKIQRRKGVMNLPAIHPGATQ
jgi:uncharacterized protein (TIGR02246 family)